MDTGAKIPPNVTFGRFQISPHRRELLADGRRLRIGGRAFDVLMALMEAHGSVVGKDDLMERMWPNRIVEENNLQIHISALRAALGADRDLIRTVAGRGYQFTGEISVAPASADESHDVAAVGQPAPPPTNVPEPVSELIGRDDELREVLSLIQAHRLVTLIGPGGIGKTRLARAVARRLLPQFADGVWIVELAPLSDPRLVPAAVATAIRLELGPGAASADHVARALGHRELLLLIDNCEHVIAGAATMAEALLRADPAAHVVTTSREPLKAEGEWTYRLPPLAVPGPDLKDEDDLLRHGAVRLFITRAQAVDRHIVLDCHITETIAAICRRLDGIPLAIELAAARTAALGIEHIAGRLDDRFRLLAGGWRTALPRHQTMHATLEWSHELLAVPERVVLRRLAIFVGPFELEAASAVVTSPELAPSDVIDTLANLVSKSLVDRTTTGYRLLETTRAFAFDKLVESGEVEAVSRRHAEYHRMLFERAEIEWETRAEAEWLADYGAKIDDVRAALDWAFSSRSDTSVGVALTAAVVPLWMELSLLQECYNRVGRALSTLEAGANRDPRWEMKLNVALAASLLYIRGVIPELGAMWTRALEIAEALSEREYQLRALRGLHTFYNGRHFPSSLDIAQKFCLVAEQQSDQNDRLVGDGMVGLSRHYLGDQTSARTNIERMLANFFAPHDRSLYYAIRFRFDQQSARLVLCRILWLQGFPDQAMQTVKSAVEDALEINDVISTCSVLAHAACPIAVWTDDLEAAQRHMKTLLDLSNRYGLPFWSKLGRMFGALLAVKRGEVADGLRSLRSSFDELDETLPASSKLKFQIDIAETLGCAGQIADGLAVADQAIERCEQTGERWLFPELLRIRGELLLLGGRCTAAKAEGHFLEAIGLAHRQRARSWELRAATSLARLLRDQRRNVEAIAVIKPIYEWFTEGFSTVDLTAAKALIDDLQITG